MANISRKALELLSDLANSGTDPVKYMDVLDAEKQLSREAQFSHYKMNDEFADILGFRDVEDPKLRAALIGYSGPYSSDYSAPYRLDRTQVAQQVADKMNKLQKDISHFQKYVDSPYTHSSDKEYYKTLIKKNQSELAKLSENPFKGLGSKGAQLLKTFYPAPQDLVLYRGLSPGSKTAGRLHELEKQYSAMEEGFSDVATKAPSDYGNRGYLSATVDPSTARTFGDWTSSSDPLPNGAPLKNLFKILVPEGTPIRPLLNKISENPSEGEVLLPPMSVYERLSKEKDAQGFLPLMYVGRGKPVSQRYIGAALPFGLLSQYHELPESDNDQP